MEGFSRFILRSLFIVAVPVVLLVGAYVAVDPFKVLRHYDTYYHYQELDPIPNLAMVSVRNYEQQSKIHNYNAFLLGSSIAQCLPADHWISYLPLDAEPYYLNSNQSTLTSIARRMAWLDARGDSIKYALIVVDPAELNDHEPYDPAHIAYPEVSDVSWLKWHFTFIKGFYHRDFIASWLGTKITGQPVNIRTIKNLEPNPHGYDQRTNYMPCTFEEIQATTSGIGHLSWPANNEGVVRPPLLTQRYSSDLDRITDILRRHNTDYRVIIAPNAHHQSFHPVDLQLLRATFGSRLIDTTGPLDSLTHDHSLWYDPYHFRPEIGCMIIDMAYLQ
ncbi:MAG: hypothetical protein K2L81_01020 [Muribaculaceae bacterium]|nr:hypothetical protein [Muribaculaceae bacterium]